MSTGQRAALVDALMWAAAGVLIWALAPGLLPISVLTMLLGARVFWTRGGAVITAGGLYGLSTSVFAGFAGVWWDLYPDATVVPERLTVAVHVAYWSLLGMSVIWPTRAIAPMKRKREDARATLWAHVSSCAVQGRMPILDQSEDTAPFSPYSRSKAAGEASVRGHAGSVRYRPPGVHDHTRDLTRSLARLAASPLATVAGRGDQPTAQAQLVNVADAIAELATTDAQPPAIVLHPSEGLTTASLLTALGGHAPRRVPERFAAAVSGVARAAGTRAPWVAGQARRRRPRG